MDAPRFHHQYLPDKLYLEPGFNSKTFSELKEMGYTVNVRDGHWSNGECIAVDPKTGELQGGQDHRSHYGKAADIERRLRVSWVDERTRCIAFDDIAGLLFGCGPFPTDNGIFTGRFFAERQKNRNAVPLAPGRCELQTLTEP